MSIRVTIEHDNQQFRRTLDIHRVETDEEGGFYDARHLYQATLSGGIDTDIAEFRHRYGDPLQALFVEAVAALEMGHGRSNRPIFDVPESAKPRRLVEPSVDAGYHSNRLDEIADALLLTTPSPEKENGN